MTQRMDYLKAAPAPFKALIAMHGTLQASGLEPRLLDLVQLRASQLNGCAYCVDMHWKDLRHAGESEQRLYMLSAWREWNGYSERERAALQWTESLTLVAATHVPDDVYRIAREQFSDTELAYLTHAIVVINGFNRLAIAFRTEAGSYQPSAAGAKA